MLYRDLFRLILKLLGLYALIISLFTFLPKAFSISELELSSFIWIFVVSVIMLGFFIFIVFKSDMIIDLLELDQGFEEKKVSFGNVDKITLIKLGIILAGGFLIIEKLPEFIYQTFHIMKEQPEPSAWQKFVERNQPAIKPGVTLAISGLQLITGALLLIFRNKLSLLLNSSRF
ncbi:hypothetical protein E7Z59_11805 [Robertkochia marina]|uniref:Uncharacterized protein n=1 Tax=Robertkochia marina TaxID=1227945 RepID=A0A4S3LY26_9FLAO|nr:hypothetical protein [Robertkochia marina]THD66479.1 hypothetical protein E7Z59_11805 [Robertkochia marina]TRZ44157.1 hypothetical protein D3A96_09620 [Robertkochia marina]